MQIFIFSNLQVFYTQFEDLCTNQNQDIPTAIATMELAYVQKTAQPLLDLISTILTELNINIDSTKIYNQIQGDLYYLRAKVYQIFVTLYNNDISCSCQSLLNAASSTEQQQYQTVLNNYCQCQCGQ